MMAYSVKTPMENSVKSGISQKEEGGRGCMRGSSVSNVVAVSM